MPDIKIPAPEEYGSFSAFELLKAAERNYVAFDHRLVHALVDEPERTLPDIVRYSRERDPDARVDLTDELLQLFAVMPTAEAIPFVVEELRRYPEDVPDDMVEVACRIGKPMLEPLLALYAEMEPEDRGEVAFLLCGLGVPDARVEQLIGEVEAEDADEGNFLRGVYEDTTGPEVDRSHPPFPIWEFTPERAIPDLRSLRGEERTAFLTSASAELRALAAASWMNEELSAAEAERLLLVARTDVDPHVRGLCWEALSSELEKKSLREEMLARVADSTASIVERASLASALAEESDKPAVRQAIVDAYQEPKTRVRALVAMGNSFNKEFAPLVSPHIEDEDPEVRSAALVTAGLLRMQSEAPRIEKLIQDEDSREDALFAYALTAPGETSSYEMRRLYKRIEKLAGGLTEDEEQGVKSGIDLRLRMKGKPPLFFREDDDGGE